jgi:hypothetical protein
MAINVNTVYQTVLLILNKEQRGYMTPVEFNRTGTQSQLEIFESYFESLNQQIRIPQTDTDYADRVVNLDEKISIFKEFGSATSISTSNVFNLPQQFSGSAPILGSVTVPALTTAATLPYTIQTVTADEISNGIVQVFGNGILLDETQYTVSGTVITFNFQPTIGQTLIVNVYPKQFYRLGSLFYTLGALPTQELERVDRSELFHLLSSKLTAPTITYPIYVYENNKITVSPVAVNQGISTSYIRKPLDPTWAFSQSGTGQYTFTSQTSCNFELHPSEQTELILKILLYAGVVIKSPEIIQVAAQQIAQEQNNQKS